MKGTAIYADMWMIKRRKHARCLRAIILTDADSALRVEAVGPEAVELNVALGHLGVGDQEPCTEDTLGKDVKDSVGDDLAVNTNDAGTISQTPNAVCC
jgi:hypothetical protein